jgi:hypothetical protein
LTYTHLSRCGAVEAFITALRLQVVCAFDQVLDWQGFPRALTKCAKTHTTQQRRGFPAFRAKFSTKLSTGRAGKQQLFSRIQNLARKVKFYFNFAVFAAALRYIARVNAPRLPIPIVILNLI